MNQSFDARGATTRADVAELQATFRVVLRDRVAVVQCSGSIDMSAEDHFRRELHVALAQRRHVVVDLSGVCFIDCAGLRCVTDFCTELDGTDGRLCLVINSRAVIRVFELTGVTFPVAPSVFEAQILLDCSADA